ncbi:cell division protein FtsA [Ruminiclostridium sufflavum DSM 19573]|uniref:Cell division protein FtsA n=1 Tax=Ruminiclostridium sufflavum DSM 19573 TaxID=1121337 RepID=A0A318XR48_9FIRM|nr:cell division protein FtsA [Ruminiclostridium sufflavum]PYG89803.1 cell division protein FtsA [Ruminiclostridium sufflavum DSM 19573]
MSDIIVGIDIGTSKVSTVIGMVDSEGEVQVLGKGIATCTGIKKGIIIDIDATSASIRSSVRSAEAQSDIKVISAYVSISGLHVNIINHKNFTSISNDNKEIAKTDVQKLIYSAGTIAIPDDSEIIDVVPSQFIVDGYDGILDPVGMKGSVLEGDFDVVVGKIISVQNIIRSVEKAGIKVDGLVAEGFAAGECILMPDEKDIGVIFVDIGGGTTEVSVFKNERLIMNQCIPVGGDHISNDLSIALKMSYAESERIKKQYQLAATSLIKNDQEIAVNDISESFKKTIMVSDAIEVIEARVCEIFSLCCDMVDERCPGNYGAGVVLSGNGISLLDGAAQLAAEIFQLPVRFAAPKNKDIAALEYCTAAGIVKYIVKQEKDASTISKKSIPGTEKKVKEKGFLKKLFNSLRDLFF